MTIADLFQILRKSSIDGNVWVDEGYRGEEAQSVVFDEEYGRLIITAKPAQSEGVDE